MTKRPTQRMDDRALVARVREGDRRAFTMLYNRYKDGLFGFVLGIVGRRVVAEDVVQEIFSRFFRRVDQLRSDASFKRYIFTCAHNLSIDALRRLGNRALPLLNEDAIPLEAGPIDHSMRRDEQERLRRLVMELPVDQREAVLLKIYEGMTFREIAKIQGVSIGTVTSRYNYGLARVRRGLVPGLSTGAKS